MNKTIPFPSRYRKKYAEFQRPHRLKADNARTLQNSKGANGKRKTR